jgi:multiple sugar transport system ATP-binding protein
VGHNRYVARVSAESAAATGHQVDLALNTGRLIAFDAQTGANLSA